MILVDDKVAQLGKYQVTVQNSFFFLLLFVFCKLHTKKNPLRIFMNVSSGRMKEQIGKRNILEKLKIHFIFSNLDISGGGGPNSDMSFE